MVKALGIILPVFCFLLLWSSCNRKSTPAKENGATAEQPDSLAFDGARADEDSLLLPRTEPRLLASLKHTPCYGHCPVYEIQFYSNGQAIYNGDRYVPRQGIYLAIAPDSMIQEILAKARDIDFFALSDLYPENGKLIADLPQTIIYFNDGRQEKTITNNHLAPKGLIEFERLLDRLALELNWQPKVE